MRLNATLLGLALAGTVASTAIAQMPMPPFSSSYTYTDSRGFSFTAPTTFVITGIQVYNETSLPDQCVEVALFPSAPNGTIMNTTQLFIAQNVPANAPVACNVLINQGDEVIIHGGCSDVAVSPNLTKSYGSGGGTFQTSILGNPTTIYRAGCQGPSMTGPGPFPAFGGVTGSMGRADVYIQSPAGFAQKLSFGTGCNQEYASFYESHSAFDLSNTSLAMQFIGTGYAVIAGTTPLYVPTSTPVTIGDDQVLQFPLGWTLPYPGGTTTDLWISSNGFVNATANTLSGCCSFNLSQFLTNGPCWSAKWRDLNPSSLGSVYFDTDPVTGTAYITFDGVPDYGSTTDLNTFQYAFDSTGTVELRFGTMAMTAGGTGWSPGTANLDPGSIDLSATPAFVTGANDITPIVHDASDRPVIGTSITLETTNLPANTAVGATLLGLTEYNPGIDLTSIGMPSCYQYVSIDATLIWIASGNTGSSPFSIPNNPAFAGVEIKTQGAALSAGANAVGALTANGIKLVLDIL
ncbi:MAG: hypothetical protein H6838_08590 [Planctomycetes bacterium]|nr:hypothetical protein [Planctomycetota bacterium]